MKTPTITNEMREEILALAIPKEQRRRHSAEWFKGRHQTRAFACGQKRQYTFEYAQWVVTRFRRNHNRIMNAYRCRYCQHWHVGRPTEKPDGRR